MSRVMRWIFASRSLNWRIAVRRYLVLGQPDGIFHIGEHAR